MIWKLRYLGGIHSNNLITLLTSGSKISLRLNLLKESSSVSPNSSTGSARSLSLLITSRLGSVATSELSSAAFFPEFSESTGQEYCFQCKILFIRFNCAKDS